MVFKNVFDSAGTGAGLFSVTTDRDKPQPGADVDFEDADDDTYDDTTTSLFTSGIHGASHRAKTVREQAPEARAILGFLASFIQTTQDSAGTQAAYAQDPGSVSTAAAAGMDKSSETVKQYGDLQKDEDLRAPKRDDFKAPDTPASPKAEQPPKAPKASAEKPSDPQ
ncbi:MULTISPECIES: hypothetical protein [Streptomyces]|uniref:Uncharacterized protein n=2 Tax=Streptomyces TaxID=1883 RepID=A0A1V0UDM3_STRVN|nr:MULTISPECIES: hypothetical protein [Streptomyces]ARF63068.1 hypothetical protein B1H20_17990 [Streptomyces violaceoruber]KOG78866.1 hypothetical protein ADK33_25235 [Streptomyces griseus subsp. rhodochrous]MBD3547302.1 hypothetical protein [Streptomyces sp. JV180]MBD3550984.1 hypothetical protein [Streptomyces sp. SP18CM02]MDP9950805.1 hypothetical protein [Streptomyces sp. DSM 41269]